MGVQISRDPFSRSTMERELVTLTSGCTHCGGRRHYRGKPISGLYRYGTHRDGINTRTEWHKGLFCSKPCHDSYHG